MNFYRIALAVMVLVGVGLRVPGVSRSAEEVPRFHLWRESDLSAIARNYQREGMNILYPRIDWRGTGPGYTEVEFPLFPWTIAVARNVVGDHEIIGRVISLLLSVAALAVFAGLAWALLPPLAAVVATGFMAVNPMSVGVSTAIMAEPLMLVCLLGGVYAFWRWLETDSPGSFALAGGLLALAILAKAPAAHIGLLLLALLLWRRGWGSLRTPWPWVMAALVLFPGAMWYWHAHGLWLEYGNSMGMSNETHWAGFAGLTHPTILWNVVRQDIRHVWLGGALGLGVIGAVSHWRHPGATVASLWFGAAMVYLLAIAGTSGDDWAYYYHIVALPPAAMLVGLGAAGAVALHPSRRALWRAAASLAALTLILGTAWRIGYGPVARNMALVGGIACLTASGWWVVEWSRESSFPPETLGPRSRVMRSALAMAVLALVGWAGLSAAVGLRRHTYLSGLSAMYGCAKQFAPHIPEESLVLVSGGACVDEEGRSVAYNASYMFYWTDRKGFNTCRQRQTIPAVEAFADSGAAFFIAEKSALAATPGFENALLTRYPVVSECAAAYLLDLRNVVGGALDNPTRQAERP